MGCNSCDECYRIALPECLETLTIKAHLEADTDYQVFIENILGNVYRQDVTSNGDGELEIDLTDDIYPEALFNKNAGAFKLYVKIDDDGSDAAITLTDGEFECIDFDFHSCEPEETEFTIE